MEMKIVNLTYTQSEWEIEGLGEEPKCIDACHNAGDELIKCLVGNIEIVENKQRDYAMTDDYSDTSAPHANGARRRGSRARVTESRLEIESRKVQIYLLFIFGAYVFPNPLCIYLQSEFFFSPYRLHRICVCGWVCISGGCWHSGVGFDSAKSFWIWWDLSSTNFEFSAYFPINELPRDFLFDSILFDGWHCVPN